MISFAVSIQYKSVTDGRTDRPTNTVMWKTRSGEQRSAITSLHHLFPFVSRSILLDVTGYKTNLYVLLFAIYSNILSLLLYFVTKYFN